MRFADKYGESLENPGFMFFDRGRGEVDAYLHDSEGGSRIYDGSVGRSKLRKYYSGDTKLEFGNGAIRPIVFRLPKSGLDCYGLYRMRDPDLPHALKHDEYGKSGKINWKNGAKERFLAYSANRLAEIVHRVASRFSPDNGKRIGLPDGVGKSGVRKSGAGLPIGYVVYPESSSDFNRKFCRMLAGQLAGAKVVDGYFLKSKSGIALDEDTAQLLNLDGNEITFLRGWILSLDAQDDVAKTRKEIRSLLDRIAPEERKIRGRDYYQYTSKTNDQIRNDTGFRSDVGVFVDSTFKQRNVSAPKKIVFRRKSQQTIGTVSKGFYEVAEMLASKQSLLRQKYDEFERDMRKVESGRGLAIRSFNGGRELIGKNDDLATGQFLRSLDRTVDEHGNVVGPKWEIKKFGDVWRRCLENLFTVRDSVGMERDKRNKALVVFDDNVSGGTTMDQLCESARRAGWRYVIPTTILFMPVTPAVDPLGGTRNRNRGFDARSDVESRIEHRFIGKSGEMGGRAARNDFETDNGTEMDFPYDEYEVSPEEETETNIHRGRPRSVDQNELFGIKRAGRPRKAVAAESVLPTGKTGFQWLLWR